MRNRFIFFILSILAIISLIPSLAQNDVMHLRVAHWSPDAPAVDIYLDGEVAVESLEYPAVTDWVELPEGDYEVAVAPAGTSLDEAMIGPSVFNLVENTWITVAAVGSLESNTLAYNVLIEDYSTISDDDYGRVSVTHAIDGAPPISVNLGEVPLISSLAYPGTKGRNDGFFLRNVPATTYDISISLTNTSGEPILTSEGLEVEAGMNYLLAAVGTPDSPQLVIVSNELSSGVMMSSVTEVMSSESVDTDTTTEPVDETEETPAEDTTDATFQSYTIADIVTTAAQSDQPEFTTLLAMIAAADETILAALSNPDSEFTVFAPTDAAFNELFEALDMDLETALTDTESVNSLLAYHVLDGTFVAEDVITLDGQSVPTLLGDDATISISITDEGVVLNDDVNVIVTDIIADNGVVHVVDQVLIPVLVDEAEAVPTEEAMPEMTEEPMEAESTPEVMETIEAEATEELEATEAMPEMTEEPVATEAPEETEDAVEEPVATEVPQESSDDSAEADTETEPSADTEVLESTIADILAESAGGAMPEFSFLLAAVEASNPSIMSLLSDPDAELTVFAPSDMAFDNLFFGLETDADTLFADTGNLTTLLAYHVVDGINTSGTIATMDGQELATLALGNPTIRISVSDNAVMLNDSAFVLATDIEASNGVIHVIDNVLIPPTE